MKGVQQPANGTVGTTDTVYVVKSVNASGVVGGPSTATASTGTGTANITTSSTTPIAANSARQGLLTVNDSDTTIYLALGTAAVANSGIRLNANGGSWDGLVGGVLWTGQVRAIHAGTGNKVLAYVEV